MYYRNFYSRNAALIIKNCYSYWYEVTLYHYNTRVLWAQIGGYKITDVDDCISIDISTPEAKSMSTRRLKWGFDMFLQYLKDNNIGAYEYAKPFIAHALEMYSTAKRKKKTVTAQDICTPTLVKVNIEVNY